MRTRYALTGIALIATFLLPFTASAQTVSSLESEIESLIAQIQQAETAASSSQTVSTVASTPTTTPNQTPIICAQLVRNLTIGDTGTDVANLQGFLAQNPLIYPEGTVSAYFGKLTQDAVERWQSAYGVIMSGTPATTGYGVVGPKTRAAIAASCATHSSGSVQAPPSSINESSTSNALCPIAPEPSTSCPGTWSSLTNAQGCTVAWQCSVPLPGFATSTATTTTTTATSTSSCVQYTLPLCPGGSMQWLGMSNGCNLGYQCLQ